MMTRKDRVRYEQLLRVRDFGNEYHEQFPGSSSGGAAFAKVAEAIAAIEENSTMRLMKAKDGRDEMRLARAVILEQTRVIVRTARGIRKVEGQAGRKIVMPATRVSDVSLLARARGIADEAEVKQVELFDLGLPASTIPTLRTAIRDLEQALQSRRSGRAKVALAKEAIDTAFATAAEALRTLDIVVPNAIEHDAPVFAEWQRQRRMVGGGSRRTTEAEAMPETSAIEAAADTDDVLEKAS
jgi:hypothetical protein